MEEHLNLIWCSSGSGTLCNKLALYDLVTFEYLGSIDAHKSRISGLKSLSPSPFICSYSLYDIQIWGGASVSSIFCKKTTSMQHNCTCVLPITDRNEPSNLLCASFDGSVIQYDIDSLKPNQELIALKDSEVKGLVGLHLIEEKLLITTSPKAIKIWPSAFNLHETA